VSIRASLFSDQSTLCAIFAQIFREFVKVPSDFPGLYGILTGFSPNQHFWGCGCTPTSYTSLSNLGVVYHRCIFLPWEQPLFKHVTLADSTSKSYFRPELCSDMHLPNKPRSLNCTSHHSIQNLIRKFAPSEIRQDYFIVSIVFHPLFIPLIQHFIADHPCVKSSLKYGRAVRFLSLWYWQFRQN